MNGVLIVDDDMGYLKSLIHELSKSYEVVGGASSGEEAVEVITRRPQDFRFAVIDHLLGAGMMDGIDTTRELVRVCPGLYPVVFSNVPADTKLMEYKFQAMEAGAYRYLEKRNDGPRQISEFVQEMEHLEHLRNWIASFHEARANAPSLLTQLDVGMDIIDRHYKIWFMNDAMRRITGFEGPGLPKAPCALWHGFAHYPCDGCLVKESFSDGKPHSGVFLSPLIYRNRELVYLNMWSQQITDPVGQIGIDGKSRPFAAMESVVELTGSLELKTMPLDERLSTIAKALWSIPERDYSPNRHFEYVRIYVVDRGGTGAFILRAVAGSRQPSQLGFPVNLRAADGQRLSEVEAHIRHTGLGYWFEHVDGFDPVMPGDCRIPFIYWPIIQDDTTIAVIEVGGAMIKQDSAILLQPYVTEVLRAIKDDRDRTPTSLATAEAARSVGEVDFMLQAKPQSAKEQLKEIVRRACELTDSHQYILRYRDGDNATLLRLGVSGFCAYEDIAPSAYSLSSTESWSCRTILAGTETLANIAKQPDSMLAFRDKMSEECVRRVLQDVNALCYEPLILEGFCIGSMGFLARKVTNYNEKKRAILRLLAKRAALALQDYMKARAIRERAEADALAEILGVVLHNIKTPLASIQIAFGRLLNAYESKCQKTAAMEELINTIKGELFKISHLQQAVIRLRKPWESRVEATQLHELVRKVVAARLEGDKVQAEYSLAPALRNVQIDTAAVEVCLEILVDNAFDAIEYNSEKALRIMLREAEPADVANIGFLDKLAIDVVDNGPGVSPDIAERLFTTMQSGKIKGAGIGLLHCRAIARSAHGDVIYDFEHSPGAKFTLLLPYRKGM